LLLAVAEDHRVFAARHSLEEDRDDAALEPCVLALPVDVGEAERHMTRAVDAVPACEVLLAALLRDPVGRQGQERRLLGCTLRALAVAGAARRREDDLCSSGCDEHVRGADHVDGGVVAGIFHRGLHVGLCREMEDDVRIDREGLADVVLEQRRPRVQVLPLAGGEVVDDGHLVAAGEERVDEIRPDEPCATCHDRPHQRP
jgi:hypothetical protein